MASNERELTMLGHNHGALQAGLRRLKSFSPKLVPMFICLGALPVLILFSLVSGWTVWKSVATGWSEVVYLQYGDGNMPYSELEISALSPNQPYDISLHLTVPATEANYGLGNFMTSLTITTYWNTTVVDVQKPSLVVRPAPSLIPFGSRAPHLLEMSITLVTSVITGASRVRARVELGRQDGWRSLGKGEGRELSVFSAFLQGRVRPRGIWRILSAFPISFSIAAAIAFFAVSASVLAVCLLPSMVQRESAPDSEEEAVEQTNIQPSQEGPSDSPTTIRRRPSRLQESAEEGTEPSPHAFPTPEPDVRRRIRRRSSVHADD